MSRDRRIRSIAICLGFFLIAASAGGQLPEKFTNLKVLPEEIGSRELLQVMRGFATSLGVRCQHCHVGEEGMPLSEFDFAADRKPAKATARLMMRMVQALNKDFLSQVSGGESYRAGCSICHRGVADPRPLQEVLRGALDSGGPQAAVAKYDELRQAYYGRAAYDFGEQTLVTLGSELAQEGESDAARAILELNLEHFPRSVPTHFTLGNLLMMRGDRAAAKAHFEKVLEIDPENTVAPRMLQRLLGGG